MTIREAKGAVELTASGEVAGGAEAAKEFTIPAGELWRVDVLGLTDVGKPIEPGSTLSLEVADDGATWVTNRKLAANCSTVELAPGLELLGDGTRKVRIVRKNHGTATREITAWTNGARFKPPAPPAP